MVLRVYESQILYIVDFKPYRMIFSLTYEGKQFMLVNRKTAVEDANAFTVIVGKNGTGKSRMLGKIAADFIGRLKSFSPQLYFERDLFVDGQTSFSRAPSKLIAVSTSPFDRFPIYRVNKRSEISEYSYLGIRELMTRNFGLAYMSKIMAALIEVTMQKHSQVAEIIRVLEYLGYAENISIRMESRVTDKFVDEILHDGIRYFEDDRKRPRPAYMGFNRAFFYNEDDTVSKKKVTQLLKVFSKLRNKTLRDLRNIHLEFDRRGILTDDLYTGHIEDLIYLLKTGLVRLRDVTLTKLSSQAPFSIADASSGEQAVVISILGIASQIQDGAVICIDEPEICLHPEWQERYIKILTSTFRMYSGCHFIIATHSPQIVSNLEPRNSYILSLETGKTINAREYIRHSSDFQLANVFNSPGFKNEYLSRIALNIFAKVSKNKTFDEEDVSQYRLLNIQSEYLSQDDPVYQLYLALKEMYQTYGRH